jgi:hypothetical protein
MQRLKATSRKALFFCLDAATTSGLARALRANRWSVVSGGNKQDARVVFCSADRSVLAEAMAMYAPTPVVVAARVPDTEGWIMSLENGAADYCAAPFEVVHLQWLLNALPERGCPAT